MKNLTILVVAILLVAAAAGSFAYAQTKVIPAPIASTVSPAFGRYQIVNGTPEYAANIMLLDTATGDSWINCSSEDIGSMWCKMPRSNGTTSAKPK